MEYKCSNCGNHEYKIVENQGGVFLICQKCGYVDELISRKSQQPIIQEQQVQNVPHCPICNSTNLSKISTVKKATRIGLFGIFGAGDIGKTYKCNNCGSRF